MVVSGTALESQLARLAAGMQAEQVGLQIAVAVLRSIQEQQERQAQALIEMIRSAPSPDPAVGRILDVLA